MMITNCVLESKVLVATSGSRNLNITWRSTYSWCRS